ncbi:MAG: hypothetical protein K9N06_00325 [Candidatus Cloacimonetes bacterium]|nr:hypothetical protein [Candidatus Cloacimonadota bacterium]
MRKNVWLLLSIIVLLSACTQKENPVGYDPYNEPILIKLKNDIITNVYSYEDTVKSYMNATVISLGNRDKYESRILFRFISFPDSLVEIENNEIMLKLVVNKQRNCENSIIKIGKMNQSWSQNYVSWKNAADTLEWENPNFEDTGYIFEINGTYAANDTIEILLPIQLFYSQTGEKYFADSLSVDYGIILEREISEESGEDIIEFFSYESDVSNRPGLSFNYKTETIDEEFTSWSSSVVYDATLFTSREEDLEDFEVYGDSLLLRNMSPTKMFLGLDISAVDIINVLHEQDSTYIFTDEDFNRMTVNKATLVLQAKSDKYLSNDKIYVMPYLMTDSIWVATPEAGNIPVYQEQFEYISGTSTTSDSLESGEYRVDITEVLQAYFVEDDNNSGFGIVFFSARESRDLSQVRFYNQFDEELKRPYIELYFTPPLLR